ncbi:aldehyde dehydrogenase [Mycena pura]|uniref:Aldehyde dehydrogenase n=1 Tax=Mycena pura TaxID=153505 RepID=A0AAD6VRQ8_9AGAR|nr:aldehyde dehydrogenase [Mycena pura]
MFTPISEIPEIRKALGESFRKGVPRPLEWRKHQLLQLARMLQEHCEAFAKAIEKDIGKPKLEMYSHELGTGIARSIASAQALEDWNRPVVVDAPDWQKPWEPTVYRAAKGTVVIIAAWNYPIFGLVQPLIGAIAAGCCAILKPSEISPHIAELLAELCPKYLDPRAYRVVHGGIPETTAVLKLPFFYTGNNKVARIIAREAANHLTPLTLELGGKSPVIVDPKYDLKLAAKRILWAKALNCGQNCIAPDYVLIPRTNQDEFVDALKTAYAELFPDGSMQSDSISRIVSTQHYTRLMGLLNGTQGQVVTGGRSDGQIKIELTVIKDVRPDDCLLDSEIFGPLLPIVPVGSIDEAIEFVCARAHPLALYAFTENPKIKQQILEETASGAAVFNDCFMQQAVDGLPFGGVGDSGYGRQCGKASFDTFSYERASIDVPKEMEPFYAARYQPYDEHKLKLLGAAVTAPIPNN